MSDESTYGQFPLREYLGMDMRGDEPGVGIATLAVGPEHLNPNGMVHGAVLMTMVDTAMGKAAMTSVEEGAFCSTVELSLRFIRPVTEGSLEARADVVKLGRNVIHLEGRVTAPGDRLIATAAATFAIIRP